MKNGSFNIITWLLLSLTFIVVAVSYVALRLHPVLVIGLGIAGMFAAASPRQVKQWEKGLVLRLGRYRRICNPGISWVVPGFDSMNHLVDMRIRSTPFSAEKTLTRDTVPINVDAVLFWVVTDAKKAILEVEGYQNAISWLAQTTLRDVLGKNELARMISDREALDEELQGIIDAKTSEWGITVQSVEIRDVVIPSELEDAMSRKAQADRERDARVILSESEVRVAQQMEEAARIYQSDPTAMQLRAMNMTYEAIKEKGALMVVPSGMTHALDAGGIMGMATAAMEPAGG